MTDVIGLQLAVRQVPHLNVFIPAGGDDDGILVVGGERSSPSHCVPPPGGCTCTGQGCSTACLVPGPGNYLTIVSGERNRHDVLGVVFEPEHGEREQQS